MLEYIDQTNRTILFDVINPNKNNLFTLIGDTKGVESLRDDQVKEIDNSLSVTSFEEFLRKFNPCIYMILDLDRENVEFNFEAPMQLDENVVKIEFNADHRLISMLSKMVEYQSGNTIVAESLSDMIDYFFPKQDMEAFIGLRSKLKESILLKHYDEAYKVLDLIINNYNNSLLQLQLFLAESKKYLIENDVYEDEIINLRDIKNAQISILEISDKFRNMEPIITSDRFDEYKQLIEEYIKSHTTKNIPYLLSNLLSSYGYKYEKIDDTIALYNSSIDFYAKVLRVYWNSINPFVQTMLGIKIFFEQYTIENGVMPPTLLIANCNVDCLLDEKYRKKLEIYLETVNLKWYYASTIWYAIIPRLRFIHVSTKELTRERFQGKEQELMGNYPSQEAIYILLEILSRYRIQTFLSTMALGDNNFYQFSHEGLWLFEDSFKFLKIVDYDNYIIPCMPNFTIIPREDCKITVGKKYNYEEYGKSQIIPGEYKVVWLSGIYVEASFVAAGLYAACQCPSYLTAKYPGKVITEVQGVSYRMMEKEHNHMTPTSMKKELFLYSEELVEDIKLKSYGVVFGPGKEGVVVLSDYTMAALHGSKDCVAIVQTMTFIERVIRHATQDYRADLIKEFFIKKPDSLYSNWLKNQTKINSILHVGENISYRLDEKEHTCIIELEFMETRKMEKVKLSQ